jgi:hypothetical protein
MSGIEANDTAGFFPDLDERAIKKLFGFLHGCFVVLTFNDLRRPPNAATFERVNAISRHDPPRNSKELQRSPSGAVDAKCQKRKIKRTPASFAGASGISNAEGSTV